MPAVLMWIGTAVSMLPQLIEAGETIAEAVSRIRGVAETGTVSDDDWAWLHDKQKVLRANRPGG